MDFKKYGIAGALIALAVAVLIMVLPKKPAAISREEILEKAREAKKIKSLVKESETENQNENG